jgi:solute carrier family 25 folate transporter 32
MEWTQLWTGRVDGGSALVMQPQQKSYTGLQALDQALAGMGAGALSTMVSHPLDVIKTRLQGTLSSCISTFIVDESIRDRQHPILGKARRLSVGLYRQSGLRAFYRGLTPNMAGAVASWGIYFWWYVSCS